ncbi:protein IMPAIRED IN BABA-INDUCED STERILITY 1 [Morus notabilis]|uniref:protein IMPAIRED IN BABA-INDUCED STERILITY 1 n=1 Tax=Morus notabilis TaxID=981085 RepID=UPI000CED62D1|nr:protein IMPAIRED IN BABA-INDUCED STERILITY 1 [Morus notabilis]
MGCINSKEVEEEPPAAAGGFGRSVSGRKLGNPSDCGESRKEERVEDRGWELRKSRKESSASHGRGSFSFRLGFSHRYVDAEQVSAGWPPWLSAAAVGPPAGEAIHGWVPLRADSFEKLEKIGQGTYSSVFRAREVETGRLVALKKVRFDNFQPESVRFMAREILILRRLDHPNIMKLEGLITSGSSSSIYLVFDYMEHDLAGLVSSPEIKFSEAQVKCYMRQLLSAIEHCHLRGIMHRDIKVSNILVNDEGILKLGDFGLANIVNSKNKQSLTSRVVTLWYRPPELLMGSTSYGVSVDLWSVGCVFAELFLKKPVLKGRTEVEQLHKIFKLCGSPSEEYWKKSKLPHATMFKPQHPYESSLRERCKDVPATALDLIETFLSVEPYQRGTASSALISQYFRTPPLACDPSTLPKYPPNKEIDAKNREDVLRRKPGIRHTGASRKPRKSRKTLQQQNLISKLAQKEEAQENAQIGRRNNVTNNDAQIIKDKGGHLRRDSFKPSFDTVSETYQMLSTQQGDSAFSGPIPVSASSGFAWAAVRRKDDVASAISDGSKSQFSALDPSFAKSTYGLPKLANQDHVLQRVDSKREMRKQQRNLSNPPDSFDSSDLYSQDISRLAVLAKSMDYEDDENHIEFSGPLLLRPHRMDELLHRNENQIRLANRKSRFERGKIMET